jgi:anti-anti-sigma factor
MPAEEMFLTECDADTLILTPTVNLSELDYADSATDGIVDLLKDEAIKNVVVDFHRTDYFGSTALGFLVRIWKTMNERQRRVAFCNLSQREGEILRITKLEECWTIHATRGEALAAVKK